MNEYEESNATIQARHPKLFKDDTYEFDASKELVMCMPFDFINGLKDKKWTQIDKKWLARLMKHLKKAQSSNIKQIRFIRLIGRLDIYENSREYEIEEDHIQLMTMRYIKVVQTNSNERVCFTQCVMDQY